jgi:large subunit ribosomal protein L33
MAMIAAVGLDAARAVKRLAPVGSAAFLDISCLVARLRHVATLNRSPRVRGIAMAKATTIKVKLVSSAGTGFYYVTRKNSRTMTDKLLKKKYDPVAKKHVEFREGKIK